MMHLAFPNMVKMSVKVKMKIDFQSILDNKWPDKKGFCVQRAKINTFCVGNGHNAYADRLDPDPLSSDSAASLRSNLYATQTISFPIKNKQIFKVLNSR